MRFDFAVQLARFLARPNRFLVMAELGETGEMIRVHCPDPGRLQELLLPGATIYLELAHLHEITGQRAAVVFIVQRPDVDAFAPQAERDPAFAVALKAAHARGVEVYAYCCRLSLAEIVLDGQLEVRL